MVDGTNIIFNLASSNENHFENCVSEEEEEASTKFYRYFWNLFAQTIEARMFRSLRHRKNYFYFRLTYILTKDSHSLCRLKKIVRLFYHFEKHWQMTINDSTHTHTKRQLAQA